MLNLSGLHGQEVTAPGPDRLLRDGQELSLGTSKWGILHTPGHSPGGITLLHKASGTALVGDTLFAGSIGRYDLPGANGEELLRSIHGKLMTLPDETKVYPGHGPSTTIGRERRGNPYLRERR